MYGPQRAFLPLLVARDEIGVQSARAFFMRIERDRPDWFAREAIGKEIAVALARIKPLPPSPARRPPRLRRSAIAAAGTPVPPALRKSRAPRRPAAQQPDRAAAVAQEDPLSILFFSQQPGR
jgi:hypothetical protein